MYQNNDKEIEERINKEIDKLATHTRDFSHEKFKDVIWLIS